MRFFPKRFPSIEVDYLFYEGQKAGPNQPKIDAEIEFQNIYVNDYPIDFNLSTFLIETFGADWEKEILNN